MRPSFLLSIATAVVLQIAGPAHALDTAIPTATPFAMSGGYRYDGDRVIDADLTLAPAQSEFECSQARNRSGVACIFDDARRGPMVCDDVGSCRAYPTLDAAVKAYVSVAIR